VYFCRILISTIGAISLYDRQEFHLMTDKFHFMTDKFHFMTEPTGDNNPAGPATKLAE